jgi:hypothetical protein
LSYWDTTTNGWVIANGDYTVYVGMQARFGSTDKVWIFREPHSGFPEQLASCELARGLRSLGLAREPVQALLGAGEALRRVRHSLFRIVVTAAPSESETPKGE